MHIALLGTGLMGAPIARRLLAKGHDVAVWNRTRAKADLLEAEGALIADSAAAAVGGSELVIVMLRDAAAVRAVLGLDADSEEPRPNLIHRTVIQMSTIGPTESLAIAADIEARGGEYLEAPVLGSVPQARDGALQILVGGTAEQAQRYSKILGTVGSLTYVGSVGTASSLKLALNQLIPAMIAAFSLSWGMVRRAGVDPEIFLGILRKSALYAPTFDGKLPKIASRDFGDPNFPAELMAKDCGLIVAECERLGLDASVARAVADLVARTVAQGQGREDYSALAAVIDPAD